MESYILDASIMGLHGLDHSASVNYQRLVQSKKVKFSHTRYRAFGPELIPVYRQSARR